MLLVCVALTSRDLIKVAAATKRFASHKNILEDESFSPNSTTRPLLALLLCFADLPSSMAHRKKVLLKLIILGDSGCVQCVCFCGGGRSVIHAHSLTHSLTLHSALFVVCGARMSAASARRR